MQAPPLGLPSALHVLGQATRVAPMVRFAYAARRPEETQRAKLAELVLRNKDTDYGRRYGFSSIATPADYARRVPIVTPDDVQHDVSRLMRGERNVLTAEPPVYYTRTTGSSGAAKHVPITDSYRRDFQRTVHVALGHLYMRFPSAFLGRALYFVGSRHLDRAEDGNDVGTMSGFNYNALPPLLRKIYAWPYELFEVKDLATRSYLALYLALVSDVSLIAGIFPAPIVYLLRDLEARGEELARDLARGALSDSLVLTPAQRASFEAGVVRRPDIASRVERALRGAEADRVATALPALRLVYCWTTSTAALYIPELLRRVGPNVAVRDAIYSATEGWCSIPMGEKEPGGPLALLSAYYEFIPERAFEKGSTETVGVEALEDGQRHAIVLTTASGLYRYSLGDIIEVRGFHARTPRILFARRAGAKSNLMGENIDEVHVTAAVAAALASVGLEATWFAVAPKLDGAKPGYALHIELSHPPNDEKIDALRARVDVELGAQAFDYARQRGNAALAPMAIRSVLPGTYHAYRQAKLEGGAAEAQLKTVHLVADVNALPEAMRS